MLECAVENHHFLMNLRLFTALKPLKSDKISAIFIEKHLKISLKTADLQEKLNRQELIF